MAVLPQFYFLSSLKGFHDGGGLLARRDVGMLRGGGNTFGRAAARDIQPRLLGVVDRIGQDARRFLRRMEAHAVGRGDIVPAELGVADEFTGGGQIGIRHAGLRGGGDIEMRGDQRFLGVVLDGGDLGLNGLDALTNFGFAPAVTA